jgi:kynureninase
MADQLFECSIAFARARDAADPLAEFRDRFEIPAIDGEACVYLSGHSLGLMPRSARAAVESELDRWAQQAVAGHFGDDGGWYAYHERFAEPIGTLVGANPNSVVAMNSLTVNLHLMLVSFFEARGNRKKILIEQAAFPSDRYAVRSHLRWHGLDPDNDLVELRPNRESGLLTPTDLEAALSLASGEIALVLLPGVQFLSGQALPIAEFARIAKAHDARIGFDLAHSIGNLPVELDDSGADFAVWCSYKYLNAGPGGIGGCYVNARWHDGDLQRLEGWWGHDKLKRFALAERFDAIRSAEAWQLSNPPILAMAPLAESLRLFHSAGRAKLREKSVELTSYLYFLLREFCTDRVTFLTPQDPEARGCQLSVQFDLRGIPATSLVKRLQSERIVLDYREPDIFRLAPVPLYNGFEDVFRAAAAIGRALDA